MNCYGIENPTNGQKCDDDTLGQLQWNAADGTWEVSASNPANVTSDKGDWIGTMLDKLPGSQSGYLASGKTFVQKNWITIMIIGTVALLLWLFMRNKS